MALVVENATVKRGERSVLAGLSLVAERGMAVLLTGPNGAGKTTLLRALAGLLPLSSGRIQLDDANDEHSGIAEQAHYIGHLNGVKPALTVAENARFWSRYLDGPPSEVETTLERLHLAELATVPAAYLSAGQKRRLGLSRLLVAPRPIWLLDEPVVSLDAGSRELLAEVTNRHLADDGIVVAATHQPLGFEPSREFRLERGEALSSGEGLSSP